MAHICAKHLGQPLLKQNFSFEHKDIKKLREQHKSRHLELGI